MFIPLEQVPRAGIFFAYSEKFIVELASFLQNQQVLETFAGNGFLAGLLAAQGVNITATSLFSGMDESCQGRALYHPVEELTAVEAVEKYGPTHDVLLMSWPTVHQDAYLSARAFGKPIVIIGEETDYELNQLGGVATDDFWAFAQTKHVFSSYRGRNMIDRAQVVELGRQLKPGFVEFGWMEYQEHVHA